MRDNKVKPDPQNTRVMREHEALIYALFGARTERAAKEFNKEKVKHGKPV